jgi:magnesium-transporting ATPase (P-type)
MSHISLYAGTPFWKLVLKQFDDLLVKILIAAAAVSLVLALINGETGLAAFLEPFVRYDFSLLSNELIAVTCQQNELVY